MKRPLIQILQIRNALALAGTSQAKIARKLGIGHSTVSGVILGSEISARVVKAINKAVGRDIFAEVEPER